MAKPLATWREDIDHILGACIHDSSADRSCTDPRSRLVVAKLYKRRNDGEDLRSEIAFLDSPHLHSGHKAITKLLDNHVDGETQWLTLPFTSGGDLRSLVEGCWADLSLSSQWHVDLQLVQTLAYLHFGITDTQTMHIEKHWPLLYHDCLHTGNVLLRTPTEKSFKIIQTSYWRTLDEHSNFSRARRQRSLHSAEAERLQFDRVHTPRPSSHNSNWESVQELSALASLR